MRTYFLLVAPLLVPIALSYGVAPATILPRFLDIAVPGPDQTEIFRALMCLHLAASRRVHLLGDRGLQTGVAARRGDLGHLLFVFARHRPVVISLVVDGPASRLLDLYLGLETIGGLLGLAVLAYARKSQV